MHNWTLSLLSWTLLLCGHLAACLREHSSKADVHTGTPSHKHKRGAQTSKRSGKSSRSRGKRSTLETPVEESPGAERPRRQSSDSSETAAEFRIFASTFNAANTDLSSLGGPSGRGVENLVSVLADGHDEDGQEADLVIMGFQEFLDDKDILFKQLSEETLFQKSTIKAMELFQSKVADIEKPPEILQTQKSELDKEVHDFHLRLDQEFESFERNFGVQAHEFHKYLADHSDTQDFIDNLHNSAGIVKTATAGVQEFHDLASSNGDHAAAEQYKNIKAGAERLTNMSGRHPSAEKVAERLVEMKAWTRSRLQSIEDALGYPNLKFDDAATKAIANLKSSVNNVEGIQSQLNAEAETGRTSVQNSLDDLQQKVERGVMEAENEIHQLLVKDWNKLRDDVDTVNRHLKEFKDGSLERSISSGAGNEHVQRTSGSLASAISHWKRESKTNVESLLRPERLALNTSNVQVKGLRQVYFSPNLPCQVGKHYHTALYAFINPWSRWKVVQYPYSSKICTKEVTGKMTGTRFAGNKMTGNAPVGCYIGQRMSGKIECGKVVNFMVLDATHQDKNKTIRLCALNTHMSFIETHVGHAKKIYKSMLEAQYAKCDSVIFVGDFNSRLSCDAGLDEDAIMGDSVLLQPTVSAKHFQKQRERQLPPYGRSSAENSTSFQYIIDKFCKGDTCSLQSKHDHFDELSQILRQDRLRCYTKKTKGGIFQGKKETVWTRRNETNPVFNWGQTAGMLTEVKPPHFAPTYKVVDVSTNKMADERWTACGKNRYGNTCLQNSDENPRHNPAWTDRILQWHSPEMTMKAHEYSRRPVPGVHISDHTIVASRVSIFSSDNHATVSRDGSLRSYWMKVKGPIEKHSWRNLVRDGLTGHSKKRSKRKGGR